MAVTQPSHKPVIVMNRKNVNLWEKMGRYGTYFSCRRWGQDPCDHSKIWGIWRIWDRGGTWRNGSSWNLPERRFWSDHTGCDDAGTGWLFHLPGNPQVQRDPCHYALGTRRGVWQDPWIWTRNRRLCGKTVFATWAYDARKSCNQQKQ